MHHGAFVPRSSSGSIKTLYLLLSNVSSDLRRFLRRLGDALIFSITSSSEEKRARLRSMRNQWQNNRWLQKWSQVKADGSYVGSCLYFQLKRRESSCYFFLLVYKAKQIHRKRSFPKGTTRPWPPRACRPFATIIRKNEQISSALIVNMVSSFFYCLSILN